MFPIISSTVWSTMFAFIHECLNVMLFNIISMFCSIGRTITVCFNSDSYKVFNFQIMCNIKYIKCLHNTYCHQSQFLLYFGILGIHVISHFSTMVLSSSLLYPLFHKQVSQFRYHLSNKCESYLAMI